MSTHNYVRADVSGHWDVQVKQLSKEILVALPGKVFQVRANGVAVDCIFADQLTVGEITTLDGVVTAHKAATALAQAKNERIAAIDARTEELIAGGFTYAGKQFSLALTAQMKMVGTHQIKDDPALAYPVNWNTLDDSDVYAIANAADMDGFYLTGVGTLRAHLDSGTALKDAVRAAATVAAVQAVVDNR